MHRRLASAQRLSDWWALEYPRGCSTLILVLTAGYLVVGLAALAAWRITGKDAWVESFFQMPGAALLVVLAAIEFALSWRVVQQFSPGQLMRTAWRLIGLSACCDLSGAVASQILGTDSPLNLFRFLPGWTPAVTSVVREFGLVLGGPCRFAFLAAGLIWVLRVYRQSGILGRLASVDWVALVLVAGYVITEARDLILALQAGKRPTPAEIMGWPVDPLLWVLLLEALLLYRSVQCAGVGWIGRCWRAFSLGIAMVTLGDIGIWAFNYGYLPSPWNSIEWYIWLPAAGAFAVAPAYQLEAIVEARVAHERRRIILGKSTSQT